jgi:hypothetical protein
MANDRDKLNRLEELKTRLFSKNYQTKIEHRDSFTNLNKKNVPEMWADMVPRSADDSLKEQFFMKNSFFKKFFIFSIVFLCLTLLYASYVFFFGGNTVSNNNIDISITGNNFTAGGEELSLIVGITNKNISSLDLADLIVEYPKSSVSTDDNASLEMERSRISLGTIPRGAVRNENVKMVLFGEQGSVRPIKISLEYRVEGSNAIFVKEKPYQVTINSTPLDLAVEIPSSVSPNQNINLNIKAKLNSSKSAAKILVKVDYPLGFQFISAIPAPSLGNNIWSLGDIAPGGDREIAIIGKMVDVFDGEEKVFHIKSGSQSTKDKYLLGEIFNSVSPMVLVRKPFIETRLSVNGAFGREYATDVDTPIRGSIEWINNLDTKLNDLEIKAKITGNAFNEKTIDGEEGFYDSATDTIIWDRNAVNDFKEINPGDSGTVNFTIPPISLVTNNKILIDPVVNIEISISGKQMLEGYSVKDLNNFESATVRVISNVGFKNKILYYSGDFTNTGPIPPKVENKTTYTVVWSLTNTANNVSKSVVRSTLPSWVSFVGTVSPASEDLVYNPSSREILWNVGTIAKGAGITKVPKSVSFQVSISPSLSQAGRAPTLINDAILTGHDDFANVNVRVANGPQNTQLSSDPLFPANGGAVVE